MNYRHWSLTLLILSQIAVAVCAQDAKKDKDEGLRIACVGDSITYGAGIKDRKNDSYPSQLDKLLGDGHEVKNFGVSGTTLLKKGDHPYWKTKQYRNSIDWKPEIVVIKLGTNDTKPKNWKHKDQFEEDLKAMVTTFRSQPSKPQIFLCLPVPAFPERWGIRDTVIKGELIPIIRKVAKEKGCQVIDLHKALEGKKDFFPDKVHPNKDGAKLIAKSVHSALQKEAKVLQPKKGDAKNKAAKVGPKGIPFAAAVPGKIGLVYSPFVGNGASALVNITDNNNVPLPTETKVTDPHTGRIFLVP